MHQLVLGLMRRLGVMEAEEEFDADTVKTKLIFVSAQLVYTLATLGPVPLLYTSPALSSAYMGLVLGWCALQGGRPVPPGLRGEIQAGPQREISIDV